MSYPVCNPCTHDTTVATHGTACTFWLLVTTLTLCCFQLLLVIRITSLSQETLLKRDTCSWLDKSTVTLTHPCISTIVQQMIKTRLTFHSHSP